MNFIVEIAEKGSISKAAQELFVSQPYLSRIVKEVEAQLDIIIFNRTNQGITLTKEGIEFVKKAKIISNEFESLRSIEVNKEKKENVFSVTTVRSSLVMEAFIELTKHYNFANELEFKIKETDSHAPIQDVAYSDVDLGVIYTLNANKPNLTNELSKGDLVYETICSLHICIILGVNHPLLKGGKKIDIKDLESYGYVTYGEEQLPYENNSYLTGLLDNIIDIEYTGKRIYVSNRASLHNILTQTNYYSIGTQAAKGQEAMFNITSIPIKKESSLYNLEMGVIYKKNTTLNPIAQQLITILKNNYQEYNMLK